MTGEITEEDYSGDEGALVREPGDTRVGLRGIPDGMSVVCAAAFCINTETGAAEIIGFGEGVIVPKDQVGKMLQGWVAVLAEQLTINVGVADLTHLTSRDMPHAPGCNCVREDKAAEEKCFG